MDTISVMNRSIRVFAVAALVVMLGACGSSNIIRPGDTLEVAFEKAMSMYEAEQFSASANAFETVLRIARGTETAADAQYYLAMSHYHNRDFLIAASEFQRFARNHINDSRRIESEFMEAYCYYRLSPNYKLDQSDTYRAIERFQLFVTRYPGTDEAGRALEYIDQMREKLAKKNFHAAKMYDRIGEYRSSALYFGLTVEEFPESAWAEEALVNQILAYVLYAQNSIPERREERFLKAVDSYQQYVQIFPRGPNRQLAEEYYDMAMEGLAQIATVTAER